MEENEKEQIVRINIYQEEPNYQSVSQKSDGLYKQEKESGGREREAGRRKNKPKCRIIRDLCGREEKTSSRKITRAD